MVTQHENSPPGRTPGRGKIYAAAKLVLGMEPTKWILDRRSDSPTPSYGGLAVELSGELGAASKAHRKTWHGLYGSVEAWPELVSHETIRRWHELATREAEPRTGSTVPPAVFRGGGA